MSEVMSCTVMSPAHCKEMGLMTIWFLSLFLSMLYSSQAKNLKPLVASLEFWWVSMALSDLYMPKNRDGY